MTISNIYLAGSACLAAAAFLNSTENGLVTAGLMLVLYACGRGIGWMVTHA